MSAPTSRLRPREPEPREPQPMRQASPIGGGGTTPYPPRDDPKNQLTFLFKAFFSFFFANHILHAVICIKMDFFRPSVFGYPARLPLSLPPPLYPP